MRKLLCPSVVALVAAVLSSTAAADPGMTLGLGTPSLSARVSINVPVTVSCSPFDPLLTLFGESVFVSVEQASGNSIAQGAGGTESFNSALLFPCDNAQHSVSVNVLANPTGPPFHGGPAVFSAFASATAGTSCGPNCFYNLVSETAGTGPTTLTMH